jgi:hypothetical protein
MLRSTWAWLVLICFASVAVVQFVTSDGFGDIPDLTGTVVGPVWVPSGLAFEPADLAPPASFDAPPNGEATKTFFWRDPGANIERGPARVSVHWSTEGRPEWLRAASICEFVESAHAVADDVRAAPLVPAMSGKEVTICQFFSADKITQWIYMTRVHPLRCDRQALTISRVRYPRDDDEPGDDFDLGKVFHASALRGIRMSMAQSLASNSVLLPSPSCAARPMQVGLASLALLIALSVTTLLLMRGVLRCGAPVAGAEPLHAPESTAAASDPGRQSAVLVIDDSERVRKRLVRDLSEAGLQVRAYANLDDLLDDLPSMPAARILISLTAGTAESHIARIMTSDGSAHVVGVMRAPTPGIRRRAERAGAVVLLDQSVCTIATIRAVLSC